MWTDEKPLPVISEPQSLHEWLRRIKGEGVTDYDYEERATVGHYLRKGFESIATNLPRNVFGKYIVGNAADIFENECKYGITLRMDEEKYQNVVHRYDQILLATGHPKNQLSDEDVIVKKFAANSTDFRFIPFVYPTKSAFKNLLPGVNVDIKGIGITFIDAVLALTEGKGATSSEIKQQANLATIHLDLNLKLFIHFQEVACQ